MNTRKLCSATSAALHIPDVERWAAPLVRVGLLPRAREEVDEHDAALLLLTLLGTADPSRASETAERLMGLPRSQVSRGLGFWESWQPVPEADQAPIAPMVIDLVRDILECLVGGSDNIHAGLITAARDHGDVSVFFHFGPEFYRVMYGAAPTMPAGLQSYACVTGPVLQTLADALKPDSPGAFLHTTERTMPSLAIN